MTVADGWSVGDTVTPWPNIGAFGFLGSSTAFWGFQTTSAFEPTFESNGTNFKGTLVFDGVDDYLDAGDLFHMSSGTMTVLVVARDDFVGASTQTMLSQYKNGSATGDRVFHMSTNGSNRRLQVSIGNATATADSRRYKSATSTPLIGELGIYGFRYDKNGTSICPAVLPAVVSQPGKLELIHRNKVLSITDTTCSVEEDASIPPSSAGTHPVRIGAAHTAGGAPNQYWDGRISEVLTFAKALTDNEFAVVKCYLSNKYALAIAGC
jgi:hypothetical protein